MVTGKKIRKFLHLIYIPATGVGLYGGYRGDEWYKERIEIFKNYTLKSLKNQENKNFVVWVSFRPQEKTNPLTKEIANALKENKIEYILTFDGLMYWDDKFSKGFKAKFMNCGRVVRGCWRNKTWRDLVPSILEILYNEKNSTLVKRIENSVNKIRSYFSDIDLVYMTRIDSDDMIFSRFVKGIQDNKINEGEFYKTNAIACQFGYIYNVTSKELAEYNPSTNPPFHTIIFPSDIFFNAEKHFNFYNGYKSHEDVTKVFKCDYVFNRVYCVTTHNPKNHISTIWNHPFRGRIIQDKEKILKQFGI